MPTNGLQLACVILSLAIGAVLIILALAAARSARSGDDA